MNKIMPPVRFELTMVYETSALPLSYRGAMFQDYSASTPNCENNPWLCPWYDIASRKMIRYSGPDRVIVLTLPSKGK